MYISRKENDRKSWEFEYRAPHIKRYTSRKTYTFECTYIVVAPAADSFVRNSNINKGNTRVLERGESKRTGNLKIVTEFRANKTSAEQMVRAAYTNTLPSPSFFPEIHAIFPGGASRRLTGKKLFFLFLCELCSLYRVGYDYETCA